MPHQSSLVAKTVKRSITVSSMGCDDMSVRPGTVVETTTPPSILLNVAAQPVRVWVHSVWRRAKVHMIIIQLKRIWKKHSFYNTETYATKYLSPDVWILKASTCCGSMSSVHGHAVVSNEMNVWFTSWKNSSTSLECTVKVKVDWTATQKI